MALCLAIDQGTHASRALAVDEHGAIVASGEKAIGLARPRRDWAEQDGDEVVSSVFDCAAQVIRALGARRGELGCVGLASQRASAVCWDRRDGRPLSPIFSWQDRRAHEWIHSLEPRFGESVHRATGLFLSPHYGASKLRWALEHLPAVSEAAASGTLAWGPMASFLAFRMLKEHPLGADPQCAARTQLWNLQSRDWDPQLLALFGLPAGFLPATRRTCERWGTFECEGVSIPLTAVNGDQSASVFAFGWPATDCAYVNIGTSAFVQRALAAPPGYVPRQLTGIILDDGENTLYMVEGNVNGAGTGLEWIEKELGLGDLSRVLPEWLARPAQGVPLFLNGIAGLGGPFWVADFRSRFEGAGEPWQKAVAVVESIAFLLHANAEHMGRYVPPAALIRVSGGVSRIDALCAKLASLAGVPVRRRDDPEATARGIAFLASGRPAQWNNLAHEDLFAPVPDPGLAARYRRWRELMAQATGV